MSKSHKILLLFALLVIGFSYKHVVSAASRYWVGGGSSANWNATGNTNWSATSGGANNASVPSLADDVFFDGVGANAQDPSTISASVFIVSLNMTGYTNTLTHNAVLLSITGPATFVSGMTYTPLETSTIFLSANATFTTGGKLMPTIAITAGTITLGDNLSFMASKVITLSLTGNFLDLNGKTVSGNSVTNRILITSNTLGTARTITVNSGTFANADFRDITLSPATDLSAITGNSGDAGGNSGITFTTADENFWIGGSGNWSDVNEWASSSGGGAGTGRVPLPQDDATFDANSFGPVQQTIWDMPRAGKNIDLTGATNSPTMNFGVALTVYGSLTFISAMTKSGSGSITFEGREAFTLTSAGKTFVNIVTIAMVNGTLTLQDALLQTTGLGIQLLNGTLNANNFNVTAVSLSSSNSNTRVITMGSGTWTATGTGTVWNALPGSGLTLNEDTSTIVVSDTSATAKTFVGGGQTYYNLTITGDDVTITGNNTFNVLALNNPTEAEGLIIGTESTQTISNLTTTATAGNVVLLSGVAGGAAETLSDSSGTNCVDYLTITNITATGGASWYAGANSTDGGGNSGWTFTDCRANTPSVEIMGGVEVLGGVIFQ